MFEQVRLQYSAFTKEKKIDFNVPSNVKQIVLWDKDKILQVFQNLIQNSIDATDNGGKIIIEQKLYDESTVEIKITDTGKGISESNLNKIFNLYFTTKAHGTGIGLSIIQRIIYEHDGIISVNSAEGKGTTFIIKLPINGKTSSGKNL